MKLLIRYLRCAFVPVVLLGLLLMIGCGSKVIQYPEDHARYLRIDQAVESLRQAYVKKEVSGIKALLVSNGPVGRVVTEAETDFKSFQEISMEFRIERIIIEGDDIDVYVHWHGQWKTQADDPGFRQRGHSRLQWMGTTDILLNGIQGDMPFGAMGRQALTAPPAPSSAAK